MIEFPAVWWIFPAASVLLIIFSMILTVSGGFESGPIRYGFVVCGACLGFLALALPLFQQPFYQNPILSYAVGLPMTLVGLVGRVYPMIYLRRQCTTTTINEVERLVVTGPYAWVRHPQYTFGIILMVGWYLLWGAIYSLLMIPLIVVIVVFQALIEERYILEVKFGNEYNEFRKNVGMLIPRIKIQTQKKADKTG
jgi:protein-S-isoprenylcysteine O-methyltransferase Ste14